MTEMLQITPPEESSSKLPYKFEDSDETSMTHVKHKVYCYAI
jgi:hypothetical protein